MPSRFLYQGFFICHIINYTGYNQKWNVGTHFTSSKCYLGCKNIVLTCLIKESTYIIKYLTLQSIYKNKSIAQKKSPHYDTHFSSPVNHCRSQSWTRPSSSRTSACALIMKLDWRRCSCRTAQQAWTHPTPTPWPSGATVGFVSLAPLNASLRSDRLKKLAST